MHRCLIICALLLAGCGLKPAIRPYVPADLFQPVPGYEGPPPVNAGMLMTAAIAEKHGREICVGNVLTIAEILGPQ